VASLTFCLSAHSLLFHPSEALVFLEDNKQINGSLGDTFCNNTSFVSKKARALVADCGLCDEFPGCCAMCCPQGEACNPAVYVPDMDPIWQFGYQRIDYTFGANDLFVKEQNARLLSAMPRN